MMRNILLFFVLLAFTSCANKEKFLKVTVENTTDIERIDETIEIAWTDIMEQLNKMPGKISLQLVHVQNEREIPIPSQIIYDAAKNPEKLIFQVSMGPNSQADYYIKDGKHIPTENPQVFGRLVPERKDDFAWENNKIAFRMYGPALEATGEISNGIDVWVKSTPKPVIDKWYKENDYHRDNGEGFDGYKVGRTLGAGAMAPYVDGRLVLGNNFVTSEIIEEGPVRLTFKLNYAPYLVDGQEVKETRVISLDVNSHLNKITEVYENAPENLEVAAGIVLRGMEGVVFTDEDYGVAGYWEPQNNDNKVNNGHIAVGMIIPTGAKEIIKNSGHLLATKTLSGDSITYYAGAGWSKSGFNSSEQWFDYLREVAYRLQNPLKITFTPQK